MSSKPILITGSHRSGTNWVGIMMSNSPIVTRIVEPFHLNHRIGECGAPFDLENTYVTEANETKYVDHLRRTLEWRYNLKGALSRVTRPRDLYGVARSHARFLYHRLRCSRPLLQDPRAVFSAEWLASRFDAQVIITIRHPAAFAASLKVKGWRFPFGDLLKQPLLMDQYLNQFSSEIGDFAKTEQDIVDQAGLLWKLIYHVVSLYRDRHVDWLFARHEDLSRDPIHEFQAIFEHVGLDYSEEIRKNIRWHSRLAGENEVPLSSVHKNYKRDSLSNVHTWKTRLTRNEIVRVKQRVDKVAEKFYGEDEW